MHTFTGQRIEVNRQSRGERLALPCTHFGDLTVMQRDPTEHLHVEMPHAEDPFAGFSDNSERFGKQAVEGFTLLQPLTKLLRLASRLFIAQFFELRLQGVDLCNLTTILLQYAIVTTTEKRF